MGDILAADTADLPYFWSRRRRWGGLGGDHRRGLGLDLGIIHRKAASASALGPGVVIFATNHAAAFRTNQFRRHAVPT
jgi:hypothetical protein